MTILRWEAPPAGRARGDWQRTVQSLKDRGDWALVVEDDDSKYAYRVSTTLRRHGCETRTSMVAGRVSVWARWTG